MQADELAFLEEMIDNAELLPCAECGEDTLHVHEEIISVADGMAEVLMRCTHCMNTQVHLLTE